MFAHSCVHVVHAVQLAHAAFFFSRLDSSNNFCIRADQNTANTFHLKCQSQGHLLCWSVSFSCCFLLKPPNRTSLFTLNPQPARRNTPTAKLLANKTSVLQPSRLVATPRNPFPIPARTYRIRYFSRAYLAAPQMLEDDITCCFYRTSSRRSCRDSDTLSRSLAPKFYMLLRNEQYYATPERESFLLRSYPHSIPKVNSVDF